jgi:hypothetical protein
MSYGAFSAGRRPTGTIPVPLGGTRPDADPFRRDGTETLRTSFLEFSLGPGQGSSRAETERQHAATRGIEGRRGGPTVPLVMKLRSEVTPGGPGATLAGKVRWLATSASESDLGFSSWSSSGRLRSSETAPTVLVCPSWSLTNDFDDSRNYQDKIFGEVLDLTSTALPRSP